MLEWSEYNSVSFAWGLMTSKTFSQMEKSITMLIPLKNIKTMSVMLLPVSPKEINSLLNN